MIRRKARGTRLTRTSEKQNKRQTIIFTLAIVGLIFLLIQFGPILINIFGDVVYSLRGSKDDSTQITGNALIQAPILNDIPDATNSAFIIFSGVAPEKDGTIEIYVNDELKEEMSIDNEVVFSTDEVSIDPGENVIKARFVKGDKTSAFSRNYSVNYIKDKPQLDIIFPSDNSTFTRADKSITVTGKTDPDNVVTVNGFRAIVESNGEFSYQLQLNDGDNTVNFEAQNPAGAISQKSIKITYNP